MAYAFEIVQAQFDSIKDFANGAYGAAVEATEKLSSMINEQTIVTNQPDIERIKVAQSFDTDPILEQTRAEVLDLVGGITKNIQDPGDAPVITDHDMPPEPAIAWPPPPTLQYIAIPEFAEENIIGLSSSLPAFTAAVPEIENIIRDALADVTIVPELTDLPLADSIHSKLRSNIENGGTMLNSAVEADIWNRGLERDEQALQDAIDKATSQWAKFGFQLPDGLLAGTILAINNEYLNRKIDRSREIAVKQAELEQAGVFKSLEIGTTFTGMWFKVLDDYEKRVFESTKMVADVLLGLYRERVVAFNARLEAFKTDLLAWKTGIEREALRAEAYKARIEGLKLVADIDEAKTKIYLAQLNAIEELVKVWETQIRSVAVMYETEKAKIEAFKAKVEAYAARVDAEAKKYTASMEGVKTLVMAWSATADNKVKLIELQSKANIATVDAELKAWEIETQAKDRELNIKLEALKTVAQVTSNIAAGALSAAHASASASYGASSSTNYNHNYLE